MKRAICLVLAACSVMALAGEPKVSPAPVASPPCYFIRTLRPANPEPNLTAPGFWRLQAAQARTQARVTGIVHGPDCTNDGRFKPLVPVLRPDVDDHASDPAQLAVVHHHAAP